MNLQTQLRRLNTFGFLACLRITDAVWVVFLISRGFTLWQVGLAEGIFHIISLLCEIPSGMAADLIGRRRSLAVAGLCGTISALLMACSTGFFGVCLSMAFSALACNFISGSDEALLYDSLLQCNRKADYVPVNARYTRIQTLGNILSNAASLLAGLMGYIGFYLLDAVICLFRIGTALLLTEPTVTDTQKQRQQSPFSDLKFRFKEHVSIAVEFLRTSPTAAKLMLADGFVTLPSYLTLMFLQQRLSELGVDTMWLGLPIMCISLAALAGVSLGERLQPRSISALYTTTALLVGSGVIFAGMLPILPAVCGAMVSAIAMNIWMLHLQNHLNKLYPSDQRATLVSVNMMAYSVLMIVASPLVGRLGDLCRTAGAGLCALGIAILLSGIITGTKRLLTSD